MSVSDMGHDFLDEPVESTQLAARINGVHLEPRCRVCRNDLVRRQINDLLACGSSYAMILHAIGEDNAAGVTIDSIRNHAERHFPVQNDARATYREVVERRAREAQIDYVNGMATALTPIALYECVMNEAFRQLGGRRRGRQHRRRLTGRREAPGTDRCACGRGGCGHHARPDGPGD